MTSKADTLGKFNSNFQRFLDQISQHIMPDDENVAFYAKGLPFLLMTDSECVIRFIRDNVFQHKDEVKNCNEKFLLTFNFNIYNDYDPSVGEKSLHFKEKWVDLSKQDKLTLFKYFWTFIRLAEKYYE